MVFVCTVHSATSAVMVVVGDGRSGTCERDDKRDVYEGEMRRWLVSELVRRVDGVVMARGPHVSVARAMAVFPSTMGGGCSRCERALQSFAGKPSPANSLQADSDVWARVVGAAVQFRGAWYLADELGERGCQLATKAWSAM